MIATALPSPYHLQTPCCPPLSPHYVHFSIISLTIMPLKATLIVEDCAVRPMDNGDAAPVAMVETKLRARWEAHGVEIRRMGRT